jgi:hypothetical protein
MSVNYHLQEVTFGLGVLPKIKEVVQIPRMEIQFNGTVSTRGTVGTLLAMLRSCRKKQEGGCCLIMISTSGYRIPVTSFPFPYLTFKKPSSSNKPLF